MLPKSWRIKLHWLYHKLICRSQDWNSHYTEDKLFYIECIECLYKSEGWQLNEDIFMRVTWSGSVRNDGHSVV